MRSLLLNVADFARPTLPFKKIPWFTILASQPDTPKKKTKPHPKYPVASATGRQKIVRRFC